MELTAPVTDRHILVRYGGGDILDKAGLAIDLRKVLGRHVDVAHDGFLKWDAEPEIIAQAVPI